MEDSRVYEDVLLKNDARIHCTSQVIDPIWINSTSNSSLINGSTSMVNLEDIIEETNTKDSLFGPTDANSGNGNGDYDGSLYLYEKKRRLSHDQVRSLEKCFEVDNKLEPDRKVQLAKELNLQPRQVAIWFQNRRARCKTKHIEKEYDVLIASYGKLKEAYDTLYKENENLKREVNDLMTGRLPKKLKLEQTNSPNEALLDVVAPNGSNSAKSEVLDPDSPHCNTDGNHSGLVLDDHSDFEDDSLISRSLLSSSGFPKLELEKYDDLQPNSCNLGFPVQDQGTWFWSF